MFQPSLTLCSPGGVGKGYTPRACSVLLGCIHQGVAMMTRWASAVQLRKDTKKKYSVVMYPRELACSSLVHFIFRRVETV